MTRVRHQKSDRTVLSRAGAVAVIAALALAPLSGGEGSAFAVGEPACGPLIGGAHEISLAAQLREVGSGGMTGGAECRLDASYLLKEDILLDGNWTAIGSSDVPFTGTFDGGTKTITGLKIPGDSDDQGLFSVTDNASIKDLELLGVNVAGRFRIGGLIGHAKNETTATNVAVAGRISGEGNVGGVVGWGEEITVSNSDADMVVTGSGSGVFGGLIGRLTDGRIQDSRAKGTVTIAAGTGVAGGFVGRTSSLITDSHAEGDVTGGFVLGGFAGEVQSAGTVRGSSAQGEIVGADSRVGGFVGVNLGSIEASLASGAVIGTNRVGGFVGQNRGTITLSQATGNATGSFEQVGGFVGLNEISSGSPGLISRSSALRQAVKGANRVGGFVGEQASGATINASYTSSQAEGPGVPDTRVGGFVGLNRGTSKVLDSYSTGSAQGLERTGGFVGSNADTAQILRSYSTARVVGSTLTGGFVGENGEAASISDSFWDLDVSVTPARDGVDDGATGKTTNDMRAFSTFSDESTVGLDDAWPIVNSWGLFDAPDTGAVDLTTAKVWGICSGVNDGYPFLLWQFDSDPCVVSAGGVTGSSTSPEKRSSDAGIHLDFQASVGDLVAGSSVVIGGQGLSGGSQYSLVVRSTPQTLASGTASALGNFSGRVSMPALSAGSHTLTLTATALDGSTLTLVRSFTVAANGTISAIGSPTGSQTGGLAATGVSGLSGGLGLAGLALLLGVAMVLSARRYQHTD